MKMKNKALNTQLDAELSRIEWTQHDRHAVLNRITEGSVQPGMKKKMTRSFAVALVLAVLTTGALAAGLIFRYASATDPARLNKENTPATPKPGIKNISSTIRAMPNTTRRITTIALYAGRASD